MRQKEKEERYARRERGCCGGEASPGVAGSAGGSGKSRALVVVMETTAQRTEDKTVVKCRWGCFVASINAKAETPPAVATRTIVATGAEADGGGTSSLTAHEIGIVAARTLPMVRWSRDSNQSPNLLEMLSISPTPQSASSRFSRTKKSREKRARDRERENSLELEDGIADPIGSPVEKRPRAE